MSAKSKYYLAILFLETGDIRSSLELVEETIPIFRHLGMTTMENDSVDVQAQILAFLGRQAEAENLRTQHLIRIGTPDPCMTGHWNNNSAWDRLMLREQQGTASTPDPRPLLLKAADIFAGQCATRRNWWRANIFVNLALAETQLGNLDAAEGYLTAARLQGETLTGSIAEWAKEIEARIALARGDLDRAWQLWCSSAWDTGCLPVLADTAQTTIYGESSSEIFILALLGRAQIVLLRADSTTAERLLLTASNHLEEQSAYVPLGEGKSTFVGSRSKVSRTLADLYIQLDRKDDAAWELRRANAQILGVFQTIDSLDGMTTEKRRTRMERLQRYHQARAEAAAISAELQLAPRNQIAILQRQADDAKRTATRLLDELASDQKTTLEMANRPPPGELWLLLAPIGTTWGAIWQWETQSLHIPLPDLNTPMAPETLADILFAPVATVLETTNHLRITSIGAATGIDVHVLPWNNAPLQNQLVVDYWVPGAKPIMELPSTGKPLVIADPGENLRFARQFGEQVTKQWKVSGPAPDVLRGENATREVVLNKLPLHSTLVYAGHARKGGLDGRNAAILLAHDTELSAADLVTHQPLPQMVVLSACEAAESQPESIAPGPGMAQAFLLGGSRMVIASVRPVDDRCAGLWTEWLLERWTQSTEENLWEAYLSATEKMRGQEPRCDYGMFRVYRTPVM
ncbi:MAG: CHAT domain-containing protein [Myxococcales bacterium]|nr:CHAT domain-containing protein [Myxococcales bacterium]